MQAYVIFCAHTTQMFEERADAYEAAWQESYSQFGKPIDIWEDIDGNAHIFAIISANRIKI